MLPRPPVSTLFPYTTLFRSRLRLAQVFRYLKSLNEHRNPAKRRDRKSTRLNSSHLGISYAVFCLKKKKKRTKQNIIYVYDDLSTDIGVGTHFAVMVHTQYEV